MVPGSTANKKIKILRVLRASNEQSEWAVNKYLYILNEGSSLYLIFFVSALFVTLFFSDRHNNHKIGAHSNNYSSQFFQKF
jgi:hypothetical protein